ncbi:unnamed protein product [Rhizophagus irregularis]|nr:unnamed protein product [Rhizophagus irregularis]
MNEITSHCKVNLGSKISLVITDMGLCKPADYNPSENTKNSNICFGIIMYEVISELPPYHDVNHDHNLAIRISDNYAEIQKQIREAENINSNLAVSSAPSTNLGLSYKTRSEDIYTSRLLNFNNLPEPKIVILSLQIDVSQLNINEDDQSNKSKGIIIQNN